MHFRKLKKSKSMNCHNSDKRKPPDDFCITLTLQVEYDADFMIGIMHIIM